MTAKQIHTLMPGDRVQTRRRFIGRQGTIKAGIPGIVQVVMISLHRNDYQRVDAADIKWRGNRIETLQADELARWVEFIKRAREGM